MPKAFPTDRHAVTRQVEPNTIQPARWLYRDVQPNARAAVYERSHLERTLPESAVLQAALSKRSSEAPTDPMQSPSNADIGTLGAKTLDLTSGKTLRPGAAADKQPRPPVLAKVELFHRDMVRREVWRQKFDFIYRQVMEQEGPPDALDDHRPSTTGTSGHALSGLGPLSCGGSTLPSQTSTARRSRTDRGRGRNPSSVCTSIGSQRPSLPEEQAQQLQAHTPSGPSRGGWRRSDAPKAAQAGARRVAPQHGPELGQAVGDSTDSQVATSGGSTDRIMAAVREARPAATPLRVLQASVSLPALSQELAEIRDQYYGGDEVLLHEDVLHASNPRLFPLRPGHGRPFPLRSIEGWDTP